MIVKYTKMSFLSSPLALLKFVNGNKTMLHEDMLIHSAKKLLKKQYPSSDVSHYLDEIRSQDFIKMNEIEGIKVVGNSPTHFFGKFLYFILRCLKPEIVVEAGVSHGASSWNILNALHKNQKGKLYSIDLPDHDDIKLYNVQNFNKEIGWVVPQELRSRWNLQLGDAKVLLPQLLNDLGSIDVFFHDSDHSYNFMMFEFKEVYPFLKNGGMIISDDVHVNTAFEDFANEYEMNGIKFHAKGGVAVKEMIKL